MCHLFAEKLKVTILFDVFLSDVEISSHFEPKKGDYEILVLYETDRRK